MTVAFVASGSAAVTAASATVAVAIPGAAAAGNLMIGWVTEQSGTATFTAAISGGTPVALGAPAYTERQVVNSGFGVTCGVWVRTLIAGDLGQTITFTGSDSTHKPTAGVMVLSGAASVDVEGPSIGNSTSVTTASLTPSRDHDALIAIHIIAANTTRTWTGWAGSTAGPKNGTGSLGVGGAEFAVFYNPDLGATSGTATGALSALTTPSNAWLAVSLLVTQTSGPSTLFASAALSTQSLLTASGNAPPVPTLRYAKADNTWGLLAPFNATSGSVWQ